MSLKERLKFAMDNKLVRQVDIVENTGIPKAAISNYLAGRYEPTGERLAVIAEYLGVSPAWLKGYTNDPINYDDPDLIAEIPQAIIEHFDGNIKKAYAAWKAADTDNETSTKAADVKLSEKEVTVALAYRAHPNEQTAVDRILEINGEAQNDDEEFVYAVARGGNGGVIKLKKRPGAGSILDRPPYKGGSL